MILTAVGTMLSFNNITGCFTIVRTTFGVCYRQAKTLRKNCLNVSSRITRKNYDISSLFMLGTYNKQTYEQTYELNCG